MPSCHRLFILIAATFWVWAYNVALAEDCTLKRFASLDMTTGPNGAVSVPIQIDDKAVMMLPHTGFTFSMIGSAVADQLGLRRQRITGVTIRAFGGRELTEYVVAHTINIGGMRGKDMAFVVVPPGAFDKDVAGALGNDLLGSYDVEFDFVGGKLNLFSQDHCKGNVVYWTKDPYAEIPFTLDVGRIRIHASLDGRETDAFVNTGTVESHMFLETAKRMFDWPSDPPDLQQVTGGIYRYPFKSLTFEGIEVRNPDIVLVPRAEAGGGWPKELYLGISVLRQAHLYFAFREKKLYMTTATAH